ncbi:sugar ABC transporter permease [Clostridium sardiniense]
MKNNKKKVFIAWCIIPALVLFCLFMVYPIIKGFSMSLYSWGGLSDNATFIGFDNFKTLFTDEYFIKSLKNTGFLLLVFPSITIVFSLLLAIFLTQGKLKEKNFYRLVFFFPNVLSMVVIGVLFTYIYDPSIGILNSFFEMLGLESLQLVWLGDPKTVLWALAMVMVWQAVGYYMVIYMAGLDGIPPELYEVADIEGATFWQRFRYVTLPMIWEIVRVTLVFFITGVFNLSFIFVNVMTGGGPDGGSEVLLTYMYKQAFVNSNYGYAMAIGVVIFIMAVGLALILNRITKKSEA